MTPTANTTDGFRVASRVRQLAYSTPPSGTTDGTIAGDLDCDANEIAAILAATTPTPVAGTTDANYLDIRTMKPREVQMCDAAGNQFYAIVLCTAGYTKP